MAEDALTARREVEALKSDLTNMVVHDLKNPVNGIAMMVKLALRKGASYPRRTAATCSRSTAPAAR
jgi:signal transduction histidine kinase